MNYLLQFFLGIAFFCWFSVTTVSAQQQNRVDSVAVDTVIVVEEIDTASSVVKKHSPKLASLLSAALPGAGQFYNKKYWKIPIVYAGLGFTFYLMRYNRANFRMYKQCYIYAADGDSTTVVTGDCAKYASQPDALRQKMETYRRNRDLSAIAFVTMYFLNIIDASVDAHFFNFDISDDLSLEIYPYDKNSLNSSLGITFAFKL